MDKFSINSKEHRDNEKMFWLLVECAKDKHRAKLAMRLALQNAADTPDAENGFWDCAYATFDLVYDGIVDYFPEQYRISHHGGQRRAVRIRK
jgi:hypothetical protein